jgi:prepilin-type N-terminal cleavage/methylation domain-containing protein
VKAKLVTNGISAARRAFTLVELLIVVAILGLLVQLMLPAVMSSQESARRLSCSNNLRQIALATHQHHDTYKRLPSGGWHYAWAGEPELGSGPDQPGGWIFNILPFVEQKDLHDLGKGLTGDDRTVALRQRIETPVPLFNCPSRRLSRAYPLEDQPTYYSREGPILDHLKIGAKTDFAACSGSLMKPQDFYELISSGQWNPPSSLSEGDAPDFLWPGSPQFSETHPGLVEFNGVIFAHSKIEFKQITDGLSKTYLVGEKCVTQDQYKTGKDLGDNEHMYVGFDNDNERSADGFPMRDSLENWHTSQFGSTHPTTWNMAFADGSVHALSYAIFLEVHRRFAGRADGLPVDINDAD